MDNETIFEKAIIQGNLKIVQNMVYTQGIKITKYHVHIAKTMRKLSDPDVYDPIIEFLYQEYLPPIYLNRLQKIFGIHVDFTKMNV